MILSCQDISFNPKLSNDRLSIACSVFGESVIKRIVGMSLYLLGATRSSIGKAIGMPKESVKTLLKTLNRDGLSALEDRRRSHSTFLPVKQVKGTDITLHTHEDSVHIDLGYNRFMDIPLHHHLQTRTILLSLYNARLVSVASVANLLGLTQEHTRKLAQRLQQSDAIHLCDQRKGQQHDYRIDNKVKSELIQQYAAHAVTGRSTSSSAVTEAINNRLNWNVAPRSIRHHINKLDLGKIAKTLPDLIQQLKKTPDNSSRSNTEHANTTNL